MSDHVAQSGAHVRVLDVPAATLRRLAAQRPRDYPLLLDSVAQGPLGRMSLLAARPRAALWLDAAGRVGGSGIVPAARGFLASLEHWWLCERVAEGPDGPLELPFTGGWAVFFSYELAREIEPRLELPPSELPWRALALRTPCALVHVHATGRVLAVAETGAQRELERLVRDAHGATMAPVPEPPAPLDLRITEEDPARHLERVRRAQEYIRAGDIYQANLSRPWRIRPTGAAGDSRRLDGSYTAQIYSSLCASNPAPFAALLQWDGVAVLSSSPERLIRIIGTEVETRPIAGTRPRTRRPGVDAAEAAALVAHPKERAEHVMLIDLERNDLGRVCEAGSVRVDELMVTETYAHVHHIVSNVRGRLRREVTPIGALRAVFPGGTITGCPKFRCMQIIAELEGEGRGAYTGSVGFLSPGGAMDLNILIRTLTLKDGEITFRAGGGIVADSDPEREIEETRAKARGLLAAFETGDARDLQ
jgi:4-amino-4-deoxychorismate synthase (2-amino-4-deoxychorismate-forming) component I